MIEDTTFERIDFTSHPMEDQYFEYCQFKDCNFSNLKLTDYKFVDCQFFGCDFSNTKLVNTTLNHAKFDSCKMIGLDFEVCSVFLFSIECKRCNLDHSSFYTRLLNSSSFDECSMCDVDFTKSDLTQAKLVHCHLEGAIFEESVLIKTDFSGSTSISLDPEKNKLQGATIDLGCLPNLLQKYKLKINL